MDFESAESFDGLLQANVRYIKGELLESPNNHGPLASDSITLRDKLILLHTQFRILTTDGQAGQAGCIVKRDKTEVKEYRQKPYLTFYMERANPHLAKLLLHLQKTPEILLSACDYQQDFFFSNMYSDKGKGVYRIPVTLSRSAASEDLLHLSTWKEKTWIQKGKYDFLYDDDLSGAYEMILSGDDNFIFMDVDYYHCNK